MAKCPKSVTCAIFWFFCFGFLWLRANSWDCSWFSIVFIVWCKSWRRLWHEIGLELQQFGFPWGSCVMMYGDSSVSSSSSKDVRKSCDNVIIVWMKFLTVCRSLDGSSVFSWHRGDDVSICEVSSDCGGIIMLSCACEMSVCSRCFCRCCWFSRLFVEFRKISIRYVISHGWIIQISEKQKNLKNISRYDRWLDIRWSVNWKSHEKLIVQTNMLSCEKMFGTSLLICKEKLRRLVSKFIFFKFYFCINWGQLDFKWPVWRQW